MNQPTDAPPAVDPKQLDADAFEQWNDRMAAEHNPDDFHKNSTWLIKRVERKRVAAIIRLLRSEPEHRVLEVGCGTGNVLARLAGQRTGVDLSTALLERARANCGPDVVLQHANAESLPFDDATFDRVVCTEVLEHLQHPEVAVAEIARVLRPGGRAVLTIPNDRTIDRVKGLLRALGLYRLLLGNKRKGSYEPPAVNEWHLHELTRKTLRAMCDDRLIERRAVTIPTRLLPVHTVCLFEKPAAD